jgi:para-aminobenzoate synthetase/4-amino-4-deoxychorismate lyase
VKLLYLLRVVKDTPDLMFDFANRDGTARRLRFSHPLELIEAHTLEEVRPALQAAWKAAQSGWWVAGFVGYEAAPAFDAAMRVHEGSGLPLVWFGVFQKPDDSIRVFEPDWFTVSDWSSETSESMFAERIHTIKDAIERGETYQVNYTIRLRAQFDGDALGFYEQLHAGQRGDFGAYLDLGRHAILSASPELFFDWDGSRIITRPMKGTVRRGLWPGEDAQLEAWLAQSEKNRAENLMIVDLLRNDLSRIATSGTVRVREMFKVEGYPTVWQMTSTVEAQTWPDTTLEDVFAALFPCGSITGAPKINTMRLIHQLEGAPRGAYCGSIGLIEPNTPGQGVHATFNVAIRTVVIDRESRQAEYGVGGGITWDSTPEGEYAEMLTKAALLTTNLPRFELLETLKLERGEYALLERHLSRLDASAQHFDYHISINTVRNALKAHAQDFSPEPRRVRLLVSASGEVRIESTPLGAIPTVPDVVLASRPVSGLDRFLYHKTTHRIVYDTHRTQYPDAFDVLLWNEAGEITEFTYGNVMLELDGLRVTPPIHCGLLAGTMRAELLERGEITERVVTMNDLERVTRIWFVNSVRSVVPVRLTFEHQG